MQKTSKNTAPARPPLADPVLYAVVFCGGCLGTGMRFGLSVLNAPDTGIVSARLGTFLANMAACFIYAALTMAMSQASWIRRRNRELASRGFGMGMCGGLSTLSALAIEELAAGHAQDVIGAAIYVIVSFSGGLLMAWLGVHAALRLVRRRLGAAVRDQVAVGGASAPSRSSHRLDADDSADANDSDMRQGNACHKLTTGDGTASGGGNVRDAAPSGTASFHQSHTGTDSHGRRRA